MSGVGGRGERGGGAGGGGGVGGGGGGGGAYLSSTSSFATQQAARPSQINNGPLLEHAGSRRILRTARLGPDFAVRSRFEVELGGSKGERLSSAGFSLPSLPSLPSLHTNF